MANIDKELKQIKNAVYGREVRGAIHDGIDKINKESEGSRQIASNTEQRQDAVEQQFNTLLGEWSDDKPIDNAETIAARTNTKESKTYDNLGKRLDEEFGKVTSQLAETATKTELNQKASKQELQQGLAPKADQAFVDAQFATIVSGAPSGTYTDLNALKQVYPNGTTGVFLILENGHWYYWNEVEQDWLDGGVYQALPWDEFMTTDGEEWVI